MTMQRPWMPMFWGDFFANTLHLSAQELGAYTALIGHAWEHDGNVAVSDLQRVARVSNYNWHKVRPRVSQFFDTLSVPNFWHHERVRSELIHAAEISNKRKAAALQKHSKSSANGGANRDAKSRYPQPHLQLPIENLSVGEGGERSSSGDPDYRAPPRAKSDNPLAPLPDKQHGKPMQKPVADKPPSSASKADLDAMYAAKHQHP